MEVRKMKKIILISMAVFLLSGSVIALAAETTPPPTTQMTVTSEKTPEVKASTEKDVFICPMMPSAGSGNVYFEKRVMPLNPDVNPTNEKVFKFKFNHNQMFSGNVPPLFRWVGMGMKWIICLLFWILLIVLMVVFIRWLLKPHHFSSCFHSQPTSSQAMHILQERYAKGEITSDQYDEMKSKLS